MGRKALEVDTPSLAAAIVFDRLRIERGMSQRQVLKGVGMTAKSRLQGLLAGTAIWNLEDVDKFAKCFEISLKKAFLEIEKETAILLRPKECPTCLEDELAS